MFWRAAGLVEGRGGRINRMFHGDVCFMVLGRSGGAGYASVFVAAGLDNACGLLRSGDEGWAGWAESRGVGGGGCWVARLLLVTAVYSWPGFYWVAV